MEHLNPVPWTDGPGSPGESRAGELLARARAVREWPEGRGDRLLDRVEHTVRGRRRRRWIVRGAAGLAAAAAASLVFLALRAPPGGASWHTVKLGDVGVLEVTDATELQVSPDFEAQEERAAYVMSGAVRAQIAHQAPGHPFVLVTPHLRIVVVGTRFSAAVSRSATEVEVMEGRVRLESMDGQSVLLGPGERLRWSEPQPGAGLPATPPAPPTPDAPAPSAAESADELDCASEQNASSRRSCFERLSAGPGLSAQNALYALGLLARDEGRDGAAALGPWREYERRFPHGALAPEVSVAIVRELLAERRYPEALRQAEDFGARFETDPRAPELALIRAKLLCVRFARAEPALQAFNRVLALDARPEVREETLFSRGACLQLLSGPAAAQASWRSYLAEFPSGAHAREVRAHLGK